MISDDLDVVRADLTIQGWRPVRTPAAHGIWNDNLALGFGVRTTLRRGPGTITRIGAFNAVSIEWADLADADLRKILGRLEET